ncbi:MAG: hypothetical protein ACREUU_11715, partial [Gammaproteobacteria bacterium]
AYNAGADRIEAAITRAGSRDFSSLRPSLPAETRDYVPAVLRAMVPPAARGSGIDTKAGGDYTLFSLQRP